MYQVKESERDACGANEVNETKQGSFSSYLVSVSFFIPFGLVFPSACVFLLVGAPRVRRKKKKKETNVEVVNVAFVENVRVILCRSLCTQCGRILLVCLFFIYFH